MAVYTTSDEKFSIEDYFRLLTPFCVYNEYADKIIRFFNDYKERVLTSDRCNTYEPIKGISDFEQLKTYMRWLSQPGGCFVFKKLKGLKCVGDIENKQYGSLWSDDSKGPERIIPETRDRIYFGRVLLHFDKRSLAVRRQSLDFWRQLLDDIAQVIKADKGYIKDQELDQVLYQFGELGLKTSGNNAAVLPLHYSVTFSCDHADRTAGEIEILNGGMA